jgi:uncharacterized protein
VGRTASAAGIEPHTPRRRCLGCGRRADKSALVRFTAAHGGPGEGSARRDATAPRRLVRDDRARLGGRGLYVCPDPGCFARASERRAFRRAARLPEGVGLEIAPALGEALAGSGPAADALSGERG